ncbi:MAG: universal stress protein [Geobacteraceae bacterium]|nr:universal stress protein [Geobacteraceae bacterium]
MFRKILVCTDLSPASDALIQCVEELKSIGLEEAVLTHIIYVANTPGLEEMLAEEARPAIERQKKILEDQGIRVIVEMPFGLPAHTLNETAERHDVSAILIGSHGKGILQSATLGSVTAKLLHQSRRPILLARIAILEGEKCQLACGRLFRNILYPTDFSETAERTLEYLGQIAAETKSPVTLLHVDEEKNLDAESRQRLEDGSRFFSEAKKERLKSWGVSEVTVELTFGDPAEEIITRANKGDFSLIVMGSQGKGIVQEVFLGSVSNKVVRQAGLPVLLIPATT